MKFANIHRLFLKKTILCVEAYLLTILTTLIVTSITIFLLSYAMNFSSAEKDSLKLDDEDFSLSYPSDWKIKNVNNNSTILLPIEEEKYNNNTYIQIKTTPLYNLSLQYHVFRSLNEYIEKYDIGGFREFNIINLISNITIAGLPAYKLEYNVIMEDRYQSPVTIMEYFTTHNGALFNIKMSEDGNVISSLKKQAIESIIKSFKFKN